MKYLILLFLTASTITTSKIKVGFIDAGTPDQSNYNFEIKHIIVDDLSSPKNIHGPRVLEIFQKALKNKASNVEVVYCELPVDLDYKKCLEKLKEEKVQYINISMSSETLSEEETKLFYELDKRGVKITVGAGNYGQEVSSNSLCALPLKNKECVGAGILGKRHNYSNYGKYVSVYEEDNNFQTSGASPFYLGKIVYKEAL